MKPCLLRTERLEMRVHDWEDAPFMVELNSDPEVIRYTGDPAFANEDEARAIIDRLRRQYVERRMGRFLVADRATGEKLGWCGLKWYDTPGVADLGYRFPRRHWGKGYATESSRACLEYGFVELAQPRIVAHAAEENTASLHVLRKLGFRETGRSIEGALRVVNFELLRDDYLATRG